MYCSQCGQQNSPHAHFCASCGYAASQMTHSGAIAAEALYEREFPRPRSYAGFWIRVVAALIDAVVLFVIQFTLSLFLIGLGDEGIATNLVSILIGLMYAAGLESSNWQGTLGKKILGLKVCDEHGDRISFGRAAGRHFGKVLSGCLLFIGFLMVAFSERKQGLHDYIAKTLVVRT